MSPALTPGAGPPTAPGSMRGFVGGPAREWDAAAYHRVADHMTELGAAVVERLQLDGDETVLDVGCGTGRVTRLLLERLPRGRVLALDASERMVARARAELGDDPRIEVRLGDVLALDLDADVDAVLSTAALHWVLDHDALFDRLAAALRPGGRLVAQCGGVGNIARALGAAATVAEQERYRDFFAGYRRATYFADPARTAARLSAAGLSPARCWRHLAPVRPPDLGSYLAAVTLGPHLEQLPDGDRPDFVAEVVAEMADDPVVDYVRLNIDARRR